MRTAIAEKKNNNHYCNIIIVNYILLILLSHLYYCHCHYHHYYYRLLLSLPSLYHLSSSSSRYRFNATYILVNITLLLRRKVAPHSYSKYGSKIKLYLYLFADWIFYLNLIVKKALPKCPPHSYILPFSLNENFIRYSRFTGETLTCSDFKL